jgi:hypothetical protein
VFFKKIAAIIRGGKAEFTSTLGSIPIIGFRACPEV